MSHDPQIGPNARFLAGDVSSSRFEAKRAGNATLTSMVLHVGFVLLGLLAVTNPPTALSPTASMSMPLDIIWTDQPGPGGGGGGGGNKMPDPPKRAEAPGPDKITVPTPPKPVPTPQAEPPKTPAQLEIPAVQTKTGVMELPGMLSNLPNPTASLGSGEGGGAGTGRGTGIGPGTGSGLGDGYGGGFGGGAYRPGSGVTTPEVLTEVKPEYTADAMRMKVQGVVEVEAIVMPDGSVDQVRIVRSLDDRWGLDQKAVEAVKRWRFRPGTRLGKPVPVLVNIELTFTLR